MFKVLLSLLLSVSIGLRADGLTPTAAAAPDPLPLTTTAEVPVINPEVKQELNKPISKSTDPLEGLSEDNKKGVAMIGLGFICVILIMAFYKPQRIN